MKININTNHIDNLIQKIKAKNSSWTPGEIRFEDIDLSEIRTIQGKEINLEDITSNDQGLIIFKGRPQMLYIRDVQVSQNIIKNEPESSKVRRFHVARNCEVLKKMERMGRYDRYRITENKSGIFEVDAYENEHSQKIIPVEGRLKVCKSCLLELHYFDIYSYRDLDHQDWISFDIKTFFKKYQTTFKKPKFNNLNEPGSNYPKDWSLISNAYKRLMNWICESCGVNLKDHKGFLHCHHKNGVKGDCSNKNLESICFECHQKYHHNNILGIVSSEDKKLIKVIKANQGIYAKN